MKMAIFRGLMTELLLTALYPISWSKARADDWWCQVILCLSNPGGPTQYSECRPPIEHLWSHLARGQSFSMCSGMALTAMRPRFEPYDCDGGSQLIRQHGGDGGREAACLSIARHEVDASYCGCNEGGNTLPQYVGLRVGHVDGEVVCRAQSIERPNVRSKPRFIDVTINDVGRQSVRF